MNNKSEPVTSRPILVWEKGREGEREATVQVLHTSSDTGANMPVIRVVSSGFGIPQASKNASAATNSLRCAA
ncbi:Uncharacterised protein [Chlamydia abortus]|jgi:hypothetical protein|uniref:Uncharacterized protein n=1 Tax=Paenibacillus residui TaxID=629724 RepID=A0ABW3DGQ8_9BACL|nr:MULTISPECIES: hypothetical protein [Paenibacillaceae]SHE10666.1 Uncharacterised protein [Chlamydia abortus]